MEMNLKYFDPSNKNKECDSGFPLIPVKVERNGIGIRIIPIYDSTLARQMHPIMAIACGYNVNTEL